jgi:hypothetical protein
MRALWLCLALVLAPVPALAEKVYGAIIPDDVAKLDEARFRSKKDWEKTMRSFRNAYENSKGIVFQRMNTSPKVKNGYHILNTQAGRRWDGINVYETAEGKIFIVVLPATPKK